MVDDYDIMHVAAWEPAGGEREELGRSEEGKKDVHAEGMLVAEGPGRLVVTLSNEHSWVRSKQVYVSVEVVPLGVEEGVPPAAEPEPEPEPKAAGGGSG